MSVKNTTLLDFEFDVTKVFVHRWPHDTPEWSGEFKTMINFDVNTNDKIRHVELYDDTVVISGCRFNSLKNVGVSIPFFKKECRMMFEGVAMGMSAHVHLYVGDPGRYLDSFDVIMRWMENYGY